MKRFYQLKLGEQFDSGNGWDLMKVGMLRARPAHAFRDILAWRWPLTIVNTIEPNPECPPGCPCREFSDAR